MEQINNINKDPNNLKIITSNEVHNAYNSACIYEELIIECPFILQEQKNDLMCKCLDTLNKYEQTKEYAEGLAANLIKKYDKVTNEQDILLNLDIIKKCCIIILRNKLPSDQLLSFLCKYDYKYLNQIATELPAEERNNIINNIIFKNKIDIFCNGIQPTEIVIPCDPTNGIFNIYTFMESLHDYCFLSLKCEELDNVYKLFKRENTKEENEVLMNRIVDIVSQYNIATIDDYYGNLNADYRLAGVGMEINPFLMKLGFDIEKIAKKLKQKTQQQYSYILNNNDIDTKKQCVEIISDFKSIFESITVPFKNDLMNIIKQYFAGVVLDKVSTDIAVIDNKNIINKTGALRDAINKFDRKEVSVQSVIETFKNEFLKDIFDKNGQNNTNKLTAQEDFVEYLNDKFYTDNGVTNAEVINFVTKSNLGTLLKDELSKVNKTISVIHSNNSLMQFNLMQDEIEEKTNKIENNTKQTRQRSNKTEIGLLQ